MNAIGNKGRHSIMVKVLLHQKAIIILNVYVYNRYSKYIKQKLTELKIEMDKFTIIIGDFNTLSH